jgi:hypothetical protein
MSIDTTYPRYALSARTLPLDIISQAGMKPTITAIPWSWNIPQSEHDVAELAIIWTVMLFKLRPTGPMELEGSKGCYLPGRVGPGH